MFKTVDEIDFEKGAYGGSSFVTIVLYASQPFCIVGYRRLGVGVI
jgi:hypothetical protein